MRRILTFARIPTLSSRQFSGTANVDDLVKITFLEDKDVGSTGIAVITLNTPHNLNALTVNMGLAFEQKISELKDLSPDKLKCAILTGSGQAFSAGGDLKFLLDRSKDTPLSNSQVMRDFYRRFLSLRSLPVPVIAAINGPAIGAGFAVTLACDIRIVANDAKVGLTFATLGLHPGMGSSHFLPYLIGHEKASKLLLTGCVISGKQAHDLGITLESVPKEDVLKSAIAMANQIATASPVAVRTTTRSLRMKSEINLEQALQREADCQAHSYNMPDLLEGLDAVKSKRPPKF